MEKIFNYPFAKDGDRNTNIPNANAQDNSVSMQSGWTLPYELNPANGGKYIERKDMNEILFRAFDGINQVAEAVDKWTKLTTENLNDIKQAGRYYQNLTINATNERNYPVNNAGYLIVLNTNINSYGVTQIYKQWNTEKIFIRRTTNATAWSAWDSFVLTSEFNNKITSLQNTDTNLNNNKEDKTKFTNGIINATTNSNLNNLTQNGFYWRISDTGSPLPTTNGGAVIVNTNGRQVIQYFYTDIWDSANGGAWFRTRNAGGTWTGWHHLENSEHAEATYRKIADSYSKNEVYTKSQCDSTFLTKTLASSTYRTIVDSYTKAQCDSTFLTKTLASSTYRTIVDSYTKAQVNNLIVTGGYSRTNYTPANISNATIPIPNKSVISSCAILITCKYNANTNMDINTTFTFKIDGALVGTATITKKIMVDAGLGTMYAMRQVYINLIEQRGKTIIPSVSDTGRIKLIDFSFLVVWQ